MLGEGADQMIDTEYIEIQFIRKGIVLTEEQKKSLDDLVIAMNNFAQFIEETIKPMFQNIWYKIKEIYAWLEEDPKRKVKYGIVKIIKSNSYMKINKPRIIHCRNNC